ncbi:MAG: Lrp/AsnC family transcriptional regulator [Thaumarchaeota archaeon]|nr:Lrp/AsnC family transcriptional regulator [Nitrososphaerota archaeon]
MVRISNLKLIKFLMENSRRSYVELARLLGITEAAVRKRVKRLEELGIIRKYTIEVDPKKLGYELICFIGIDVAPERYVKLINDLRERPEVIKLYSTSGDHTILAECWFKNLEDLTQFMEGLESCPGVTRVCPAVVLQRIK